VQLSCSALRCVAHKDNSGVLAVERAVYSQYRQVVRCSCAALRCTLNLAVVLAVEGAKAIPSDSPRLERNLYVALVLQCVAARCSVLQRVAACCSVLQRVAACCSVLQHVARYILPSYSPLKGLGPSDSPRLKRWASFFMYACFSARCRRASPFISS